MLCVDVFVLNANTSYTLSFCRLCAVVHTTHIFLSSKIMKWSIHGIITTQFPLMKYCPNITSKSSIDIIVKSKSLFQPLIWTSKYATNPIITLALELSVFIIILLTITFNPSFSSKHSFRKLCQAPISTISSTTLLLISMFRRHILCLVLSYSLNIIFKWTRITKKPNIPLFLHIFILFALQNCSNTTFHHAMGFACL